MSQILADSEEILPIWSATGFDSGKWAPKSAVHRQGLWHPTAQIWLWRQVEKGGESDPEWLLQLRSPQKDNFPSCWDVSVAGHVSYGETIEEGALRELKEELGCDLAASALQFLFRMPYFGRYENALIDCEWQHVYLAQLPLAFDIDTFSLQLDEVSALRWVSWPELEMEWADLVDCHCAGHSNGSRNGNGSDNDAGRFWREWKVRGFALHRHYPTEANPSWQVEPKSELAENYYWARMLLALDRLGFVF